MSVAIRPMGAAPADSALERENRELRLELAALARDNKSLQNRTRTMTAALLAIQPRTSELPAPVVIGVYGVGDTVTALVTAAQTTEVFGDVPAIRFVRNVNLHIVGVELVKLASDEDTDDAADEFDATFRTLATLALVGGERRS